jgi:hypothetical protein
VRAASASGVATGRLDLHDIGSHVAEDLSGEEARLVAQVEDADAIQHTATLARRGPSPALARAQRRP